MIRIIITGNLTKFYKQLYVFRLFDFMNRAMTKILTHTRMIIIRGM